MDLAIGVAVTVTVTATVTVTVTKDERNEDTVFVLRNDNRANPIIIECC
jgi:hypothetical protein